MRFAIFIPYEMDGRIINDACEIALSTAYDIDTVFPAAQENGLIGFTPDDVRSFLGGNMTDLSGWVGTLVKDDRMVFTLTAKRPEHKIIAATACTMILTAAIKKGILLSYIAR